MILLDALCGLNTVFVCVCVGAPVDLLFMYVHMCLRVFIECVCDTNTI